MRKLLLHARVVEVHRLGRRAEVGRRGGLVRRQYLVEVEVRMPVRGCSDLPVRGSGLLLLDELLLDGLRLLDRLVGHHRADDGLLLGRRLLRLGAVIRRLLGHLRRRRHLVVALTTLAPPEAREGGLGELADGRELLALLDDGLRRLRAGGRGLTGALDRECDRLSRIRLEQRWLWLETGHLERRLDARALAAIEPLGPEDLLQLLEPQRRLDVALGRGFHLARQHQRDLDVPYSHGRLPERAGLP